MHHEPTTPFGQRPVSAGLLATATMAEQANTPCPKWPLFHLLCQAREAFGLSNRDLAVLNALLTFHPAKVLDPSENLVVFPSNKKLSERLHGMPESTLRRHLAALVKSGVLHRRDSANGKRYARRSAGTFVSAYGFDLRPFVALAAEVELAANEAEKRTQQLADQREQLAIAMRDIFKLSEYLGQSVEMEPMKEIQKCLRRQPNVADIKTHLTKANLLKTQLMKQAQPKEMSGQDSQNERHIQNSNINSFDSEKASEMNTVESVLPKTPEFATLCPDRIRTWKDMVQNARNLRPMIGITDETWWAAENVMGETDAATTLACMIERLPQIKNPGGYLRRLTQKAKAQQFTPQTMLAALA